MIPSTMTKRQAMTLHNIIPKLGGPGSYHSVFKAIQERIKKVFVAEMPEDAKADLDLSKEEKSVLAEQLSDFFENAKRGDIKNYFSDGSSAELGINEIRDLLVGVTLSIGKKFSEFTLKKIRETPIKVPPPAEFDEDGEPPEEENLPQAGKAPEKTEDPPA